MVLFCRFCRFLLLLLLASAIFCLLVLNFLLLIAELSSLHSPSSSLSATFEALLAVVEDDDPVLLGNADIEIAASDSTPESLEFSLEGKLILTLDVILLLLLFFWSL